MRFIWSQLRTNDSQTTTVLQKFPRFGNRKVKSPKREDSIIAGCFSTPMITHWALRKSTSFPFYHLILFHKLHKAREGMWVWEATRALLLIHRDTEPNTKYFLLHWILTPRSVYWLKIQRGCFPGSNANLRLRKSRFNSLPHHILPVWPWAINISVPQSFHLWLRYYFPIELSVVKINTLGKHQESQATAIRGAGCWGTYLCVNIPNRAAGKARKGCQCEKI